MLQKEDHEKKRIKSFILLFIENYHNGGKIFRIQFKLQTGRIFSTFFSH